MLAATALFFHTLINPEGDLAESLRSTNVRVVIITVLVFLLFTLAVRVWFTRRDRRQGLTAQPHARAEQVIELPDATPARNSDATPAASATAPPTHSQR
ncbi:MAG TPA: hypothetical protein VIK61_10875 [Acidimicrobiia bacterium]